MLEFCDNQHTPIPGWKGVEVEEGLRVASGVQQRSSRSNRVRVEIWQGSASRAAVSGK